MDKLIKAARGVREVRNRQAVYTKELQRLAIEARKTKQNLSNRIPDRPVFDYGTAIDRLCDALDEFENDKKSVDKG